MQKAVNPETGEVLFLVNNQWVKPTQTATNPDTGENAYLVNNAWQVMPMPKPAAPVEPTLSPEEQMMSSVGQTSPQQAPAGMLAGTKLPADAGPMGNREISEVGVAPVPGLKDMPVLDSSQMPTAEDRAKAQFGITPEMDMGDKAMRTVKGALYGASTGLQQRWLGGARMISDITGLGKEGVEGVSKQLGKEQAAVEQTYAPEYGLKIAKDIGSSVVQNIPTIGVGLYAGAPAALVDMFSQSFMQTYDDSRNEGMGIGASTARSALYGTAEAIGESLGFPNLLKSAKAALKGVPTVDLAKEMSKYILKEIPGEQLTYVSQFLTDKGFGLNPEAGMKEFLQGVQDTALVTVGQTAIMGGGIGATNKILKELRSLHSKGDEGIPNAADMVKQAGFTFERPAPQGEVTVQGIPPEAVVPPPVEAAPAAAPEVPMPAEAVPSRAVVQEGELDIPEEEGVTAVTPTAAPVEAPQKPVLTKKPNDPAIEAEAVAIADELEKLGQKDFAIGFRSKIEKDGGLTKPEDLNFYRSKLLEAQQKAGTADQMPKEAFNIDNYMPTSNKAEIKRFKDFLPNAPEEVKTVVDTSNKYLQDLTDKINSLGYKVLDVDARAPQEVQELKRKISGIAGSTFSFAKNAEHIAKENRFANPEKLARIKQDLDKDFADADQLLGVEAVAPQPTEVVQEPAQVEAEDPFAVKQDEKILEKARNVYKKIIADNPNIPTKFKEGLLEEVADPDRYNGTFEEPNSKNLKIGDTVYEKGDPVPKYVVSIRGDSNEAKIIDSKGESYGGWSDIDDISTTPIDFDHKFDFGFGPVNVNVNKWLSDDNEWQFSMYGPGASKTGFRSVLGIYFEGKPGTKEFDNFVERVAKENALKKAPKAKKPTKEEKVAANKARQAAKKENLGTVESIENGVPVKTTYEREPNDNITITKETPEGTIVTKLGGGKGKTKSKQTFIPKEAHIEGKKSEPVTDTAIEDAIDKAETKVDAKKIKQAIKNQFDQAIKRAEFSTNKAWSESKKAEGKYVTIDIPGDGKFTVKNNVERLQELQKRLTAALPLKTGKPVRKPSAASVSAPETAFANMVNEGDMENALEYARVKKMVPTNAGLTPQGIKNLEKALGGEKGALQFKAEIEGKPVEEVETYQESMDRINAKMKAEGRESDYAKAAKALAETKAKIKELEDKKPTKKEKSEAYKQKLKDILGIEVGDTVTFNQDIEYASKDTQYEISAAGEKAFGIYNPANDARTTINYSTVIRQKGRGLTADKVKKAAKEEYTPEQRENAEHHAKDLGGEIVWQDGDLSLIRGYEKDSGAPGYIVAKGDLRGRTIIQDYKGDLIDKAEKEKLIKIAEQAEKDAQAKHKSDPFIKFIDGISLSEDIPADLGGVIKEWKKLLGLKTNIYVSTLDDAKANRNNFTGPHRVIGSGTLSANEAGSMRRMPDDSYYVLFDKSTSKTKMLETIAHELGHVHEREVFISAPEETKKAIKEAHQDWLKSQKGKTAQELVDSLRAKTSAKTTNIQVGAKVENLSPYWTSFNEWYADQVSKWATTTEKPLNVVEKFFKNLGNQMRQFYQKLKNAGYLPNETVKQYLDSMAESKDVVADRGDDVEYAPEAMVKKVEPESQEVKDLLEKHNRPNTPLHPSSEVADAFMGSVQKGKKIYTRVKENPMMAVPAMVSKLDRATTHVRNKNIWYGSGLEQSDFAKYNGQLRTGQGDAIASVAVTNAIHAGHVGTQVLIQGQLEYNDKTQMFQAAKSDKSMANVIKLKSKLMERIGDQEATDLINGYFEAKRSRSIINEYLNREAAYEMAVEQGEDQATAAKNLKNIEVARQKVNMDDEQIDDFIAMDKKFPELRQMMDNWTAVNHNMLDNMVFSGVISKRRAKELKAIEDYVPWYRIMDEQTDINQPTGGVVRGLTNVAQDKKFKKGEVTRDIDDIVDNMIHNVMMMTRNSMRNYAANRVVMEYGTRNDKGKLKVFATEGVDSDGVRFNVIVNGRRVIVQIKDPLIAESVIGMENIEIPMNKILATMANGLRRTITFSGVFQVKQLFMDAPTAAWVSGLKNPFAVWGSTFSSFLQSLRKDDPIVKMLKSYGIGGFQSTSRTPEKELKLEIGLLNHSAFAKAIKFLDHVGDSSDYAQRRAIYKRVMKETSKTGNWKDGDQLQALLQANNVIDFLKHGSGQTAQFLTRTVSFMNAYAQQIDVLAQTLAGGGLKGKDRKKGLERMAITGGLLAATTLLYCFAVGADDDYQELDDQTKLRNLYIPGSKKAFGHAVLLPMHTSASFFFKAIPELIYNKVMNQGTKNEMDNTRLRTALKDAAIDSLVGPNAIPTGAKPFIEIGLNHSFFTGGQLTPKGMENLEAAEQYSAATSELGKVISALTSVPGTDKRVLNPIESDHLMRSLFGSVAAMSMWGSNLMAGDRPEGRVKDIPIIGQFVAPEVPRRNEAMFYDFKDRSDEKYNTYMKLLERDKIDEADKYLDKNMGLVAAHDYVTAMDSGLKEINKQIRSVGETRDPSYSKSERRKDITDLQNTKKDILEDIGSMRKDSGL